jgi:hypothetical protein
MESLQKVKSQLDSLQLLVLKINESAQWSSLDKDLILSKLRDVYEDILRLDAIEPHFNEKGTVTVVVPPKAETSIVEEITEKEFEEAMLKEIPIEFDEPLPVSKPKKQYDDDLLIRIDDVPSIEIHESKPVTEPVIEKKQATVEVTTAAVSNESLAAKLSHSKIESIAGAISVGDKMMFQKQLFKDRNEEFLRTLHSLNDLESYEEAVAWLEASYSWDFNSPMVKKFLEIVQRRF